MMMSVITKKEGYFNINKLFELKTLFRFNSFKINFVLKVIVTTTKSMNFVNFERKEFSK